MLQNPGYQPISQETAVKQPAEPAVPLSGKSGHRLVVEYRRRGNQENCFILLPRSDNNKEPSRKASTNNQFTGITNRLRNVFFSSEQGANETELARKNRNKIKNLPNLNKLQKKLLEHFANNQQINKLSNNILGGVIAFKLVFTGAGCKDYQKEDAEFFELLLRSNVLPEQCKTELRRGKKFTVEVTILTNEKSTKARTRTSVDEGIEAAIEAGKSDIACSAPPSQAESYTSLSFT